MMTNNNAILSPKCFIDLYTHICFWPIQAHKMCRELMVILEMEPDGAHPNPPPILHNKKKDCVMCSDNGNFQHQTQPKATESKHEAL
jgi:hypothetical protein